MKQNKIRPSLSQTIAEFQRTFLCIILTLRHLELDIGLITSTLSALNSRSLLAVRMHLIHDLVLHVRLLVTKFYSVLLSEPMPNQPALQLTVHLHGNTKYVDSVSAKTTPLEAAFINMFDPDEVLSSITIQTQSLIPHCPLFPFPMNLLCS